MQTKETDWLELWRTLVLSKRGQHPEGASIFTRKERAEKYEADTRRKNREKSDVLLDFVKNDLRPGEIVLDIGAGTGRWTVPLAKVAAKVTAVEPAGAMMEILKGNVQGAGVNNVEFVQAAWEAAGVERHDIVTCAHAMYMSADFGAFVRKMEAKARRRCYMAMRLFPIDGIIQEVSEEITGLRHDGPNFIVGYNALYQMGIYGNVLIEDSNRHWTDDTVESAFARAKRHLHLEDDTEYDRLIHETLKRRLTYKDGVYTWPDGMHSVLVWWDVVR